MYSANIASQNSIKSPTPNKRTLVEDRGVGDCRSTILLAEMHPFYSLSWGYGITSSTIGFRTGHMSFLTPKFAGQVQIETSSL